MQGEGISSLAVDTLDDVDFPRAGPVWAIQPKRRPRTTAFGHMIEVQDDEGVVVRLLALDTHGIAPTACASVCGVGGHTDSVICSGEQTGGLCFVEGHIIHVAISWIVTLRAGQRRPVRLRQRYSL